MPETPVIKVIDNLAAEPLRAQACAVCAGPGWFFGNRSGSEHSLPFWKMDLDGNPVFDALWETARPRCEEIAGGRLRVIRQYANGHTYGLGGQPHRDDDRPGTFTFLYYPMEEWKPEWQGETVFHDKSGEIGFSVTPTPNRAVFFDARIPHAGRAPARSCPALRITVAFKLELVPDPVAKAEAGRAEPVVVEEIGREGSRREYKVRSSAGHIAGMVAQRLQEMGKTVRLPGFRAGKIPLSVLESRYGARTRSQVIGQIGTEAAVRQLRTGGLPAAVVLESGAESGDLALNLAVTHMPDLPDINCAGWEVTRLTVSGSVAAEAGLSEESARLMLDHDLHRQVLDHLNEVCQFPVAPAMVDREFVAIRRAADELAGADNAEALSAFREVAERRVRLGAVIAELARRHKLSPGRSDSGVEPIVIDWLLTKIQVVERPATAGDLLELL